MHFDFDHMPHKSDLKNNKSANKKQTNGDTKFIASSQLYSIS